MSTHLSPQDWAAFRARGYVVLPPPFTPEELARFRAIYEHDRKTYDYLWRPFGVHQTINCDALVSSPRVDSLIRHAKVLPVVEELLGGEVCFGEICLRHMAPYDGQLSRGWHRDRPHNPGHPLRADYLQLMLYLSDVHEGTHCFSISPESVDEPVLEREEQLAKRGFHDLHGPAGTAILFNVSLLHSATVRPTRAERHTIQIYYGRTDRPCLSNDSLMPPSFWRDHPDPQARRFYGHLNDKSRLYLRAFEGASAEALNT